MYSCPNNYLKLRGTLSDEKSYKFLKTTKKKGMQGKRKRRKLQQQSCKKPFIYLSTLTSLYKIKNYKKKDLAIS